MNAVAFCDDSVFTDLIDSVAPEVNDVIVLIKSYFDESYDANLLCVAGYSFTSAKSLLLDDEWRKMLTRFKRLPFFRMSACNANRDPFDRLTEPERVAAATHAIGLINKYATFGYAVTVDEAAFNKIVTNKGFVSTPYEFCTWLCLVTARTRIDKLFPLENMSFFFEAGFRHQAIANRMMDKIFKSPELRADYNYKAHVFVDKTACRPSQAADILAWQWFKDSIRRKNGANKMRGDFAALIEGTPHYMIDVSADQLQWIVDAINAKAGTPIWNEIAGLVLSNPSSPIFQKRPAPSC